MADKRGISGRNLARLDNTLGVPTFLLRKAVSGAETSHAVVSDVSFKLRVLDMWAVKTGGAGGASDTVRLDRNTTAITSVLDMNVADNLIVRPTTIDDAEHELSVGDDLSITSASSAAAEVYVLCCRV